MPLLPLAGKQFKSCRKLPLPQSPSTCLPFIPQLPPLPLKPLSRTHLSCTHAKQQGGGKLGRRPRRFELVRPSLPSGRFCFFRSLSNPIYLHTFQYQYLKPAKPVTKSPNFLFTLFFKYKEGAFYPIPVSSKMALSYSPTFRLTNTQTVTHT